MLLYNTYLLCLQCIVESDAISSATDLNQVFSTQP